LARFIHKVRKVQSLASLTYEKIACSLPLPNPTDECSVAIEHSSGGREVPGSITPVLTQRTSIASLCLQLLLVYKVVKYLSLVKVTNNYRACVTIPRRGWERMRDALSKYFACKNCKIMFNTFNCSSCSDFPWPDFWEVTSERFSSLWCKELIWICYHPMTLPVVTTPPSWLFQLLSLPWLCYHPLDFTSCYHSPDFVITLLTLPVVTTPLTLLRPWLYQMLLSSDFITNPPDFTSTLML
jgi:hypothetical protein